MTGGAGFFGSNPVKLLVEGEGHEVLNLDSLTYAGNLSSFAELGENDSYQFVEGLICDAAIVAKSFDLGGSYISPQNLMKIAPSMDWTSLSTPTLSRPPLSFKLPWHTTGN